STRVAAVLEGGRGVRLDSGERLEADAVVLAVAPQEALRLVGELGHLEREILAGCRSPQQAWVALALEPGPRLLAAPGWAPERPALLEASPAERGAASLLVRAYEKSDPQALCAHTEALVPGLARRVRAAHAFERAVPAFGVGHFRKVARLFAEAERRPQRR